MVDNDRMAILHYAAKFGDARTVSVLEMAEITGLSPEWRDKVNQNRFRDLRWYATCVPGRMFRHFRAITRTVPNYTREDYHSRKCGLADNVRAGYCFRCSDLADEVDIQYLISLIQSSECLFVQCGSLSRDHFPNKFRFVFTDDHWVLKKLQ